MPVLLNPWSTEYIRQLAQKAAYEARQNNLRPIPVSQAVMNYRTNKRFNIPFLGDYVPDEWERTGEITHVDTTGLAQHGDPAMPAFDFYRSITKGIHVDRSSYGLGVIEIEQDKALVATYRRRKEETNGNSQNKN